MIGDWRDFSTPDMPTVLRHNGFQVRIYTNDHPPSHVHVFKAEGELVFNLGSESEAPRMVKELSPMNPSDARQAGAIVREQKHYLLREWRKIHGNQKEV
ncbi:MAG: DUF4160 domain-containing protein [Acidobacteria bacterium]|nr:DUF4160 domain-containing protein [Acidobacteriota bacterium]